MEKELKPNSSRENDTSSSIQAELIETLDDENYILKIAQQLGFNETQAMINIRKKVIKNLISNWEFIDEYWDYYEMAEQLINQNNISWIENTKAILWFSLIKLMIYSKAKDKEPYLDEKESIKQLLWINLPDDIKFKIQKLIS